VALSPVLGDPDLVPQETGCFNTLDYLGAQAGTPRWSVVRVNEVPGSGEDITGPDG